MTDKFEDLCVLILRLRDHKRLLIRRTVLKSLPLLAKFNPTLFADQFLRTAADTLLLQLNDSERDIAFASLGELAVVLAHRMLPVTGPIVTALLQLFRLKAKGQRSAFFPAAFQCVSMLARGVGTAITDDMKSLICTSHNNRYNRISAYS